MATIGKSMTFANKYPNAFGEISWFDTLLPRVRNLRFFLSDTEIVTKLVASSEAMPEHVWMCLKAAAILDGKRP